MKRLLLENLGWKVVSLVLAAVLWYVLVGEPEYTASVTAAVLYSHVPGELELGPDRPENVRVELAGGPDALDREHLSGVAVVLDLGDIREPGERTYTITQANLRLPRGVRFVRAIPSQIRLSFERRASRMVPVRVRFANQGKNGYALLRFRVEPERLKVTGPESRVRELQWAETDPVDLAQVTGEKVVQVSAFLRDPQLRFEDSPLVNVYVETARIKAE